MQVEAAIDRLREAGWEYAPPARARGAESMLPAGAPVDAAIWVGAFSRLASADDAVWFVALDDYAADSNASDDAFAWNAFETLSLEASSSDAEVAAVTDFWRRHLPILLSVRGPYIYLALRDDGVVVLGEEPEFEAARPVADDLGELLGRIAAGSVPGSPVLDRLLFGG